MQLLQLLLLLLWLRLLLVLLLGGCMRLDGEDEGCARDVYTCVAYVSAVTCAE